MMKGHEHLIEMRQKRKKPAIVFLNDFPCLTDWHKWSDESVTICTHGDSLETLDLRFLVGLKVSIVSKIEKRAKQLFDMVKAAGAIAIAASHIKSNKPAYEQDGWVNVWAKEDVNHG